MKCDPTLKYIKMSHCTTRKSRIIFPAPWGKLLACLLRAPVHKG